MKENLIYKYFKIKEVIMENLFDDLEKRLKKSKTFEELAIILLTYGGKGPKKIDVGLKVKELLDEFGNDFKKAKTHVFKDLYKKREQYFSAWN